MNHVYKELTVDTTIASSSNEGNIFLIPINIHIATQMGISNSDRLFYDSVYLITNSYDRQKLKWYETSLFGALVKIVAIIVTIYSLGSMASVAFAAATVAEAALVIMTKILITLSIKMAIDFALDTIGIEAAMIIAAALAVYVLGSAGGKVVGLEGLPLAEELLSVMQIMVAEITEDFGELVQDIADEMTELASTQSEIEKEFDELRKELSATATLDYNEVIRLRPNIDLTESPSEFYYRSIHASNIGVNVLDTIQVYVENKLRLPENPTIGI